MCFRCVKEFSVFERDADTPNANVPRLLSKTGLFTDTRNLVPQSGLTEYDVNSPLWSDGASKRRFVALPDGQFINFRNDNYWDLPNRSVLVKHFELPSSATTWRRIETRVLVKSNDKWSAFTYVWNEAQTDAELVVEGTSNEYEVWNADENILRTQRWVVPSQNQCFQCHTQNSNIALGLSTLQLNKDDQLNRLNDLQLLKGFDPSTIPTLDKLVNPRDTKLDLALRARSYLHSQCFHCHMPQGTTPANIDLRYSAATEDLFRAPLLGSGGITDPLIIKPGVPNESILFQRFLRGSASGAMPPLGVEMTDQHGADLLKQWIESLNRK
jgi:uncharacterized repeat protein (TIGR03806 family)